MTAEAFERFRAAVLADTTLQAELQAVEAWDAFVAAAVSAAAARGIALGERDLEEAREEARRAWFERWI